MKLGGKWNGENTSLYMRVPAAGIKCDFASAPPVLLDMRASYVLSIRLTRWQLLQRSKPYTKDDQGARSMDWDCAVTLCYQ